MLFFLVKNIDSIVNTFDKLNIVDTNLMSPAWYMYKINESKLNHILPKSESPLDLYACVNVLRHGSDCFKNMI